MTEVIRDALDVDMTIAGEPWYVSDAKVMLSYQSEPNYVELNNMVPAPDQETPKFDDNPVDNLVGADFELHVDNSLVSERDIGDEETLLFKGKLGNISAIGAYNFEGRAYDPSQQLFNAGEDNDASPGLESGSILNQTVPISFPYTKVGGVVREPRTIQAGVLVQRIISRIPGFSDEDEDVDITLEPDGRTVTGPGGEITVAYDEELRFESTQVTIKQALDKIREQCDAEWWFDKEGVFHLGAPDPTAHELKLITDASDGYTTPPYQSVKVIGSAIASEEGKARSQMYPDERIVVEAAIGQNVDGSSQPVLGRSNKPQFTYRNNEISTTQQAKNTARKLVKDLAAQQRTGKVTVVGYPEVTPLDAIIMPHNDPKSDAPNFQENMPMGGGRYGVYKVVHKLNGSDGFKTEIHVQGLVGVQRVRVPSVEDPNIENPPRGRRRFREAVGSDGVVEDDEPDRQDFREAVNN